MLLPAGVARQSVLAKQIISFGLRIIRPPGLLKSLPETPLSQPILYQ